MDKTHHYAPVNVRNPISLYYTVKVLPGQSIRLSLDDDLYPDSRLEVGPYFEIKYIETDAVARRKIYCISPIGDYSDWAKYSALHLGEIWVDSNTTISRLLPVLECSTPEKMDHITIINPEECDMKVRPHQIVELVVYDLRFGYQDEWNWSWNPLIPGIALDEIGADHLTVFSYPGYDGMREQDDPTYRYARCRRFNTSGEDFCRQHHFWFRFNSGILDVLDLEKESERIGELSIRGYANSYQKHSTLQADFKVNIYVDLKSKFRSRVLHTLGLERRNVGVIPPSRLMYNKFKNSPSVSYYPKRHYGTIPPKRLALLLREVNVKKVAMDNWDKDCKTLSAHPPQTPFWRQQIQYDDEFVIVGQGTHGQGMHGHYGNDWY